MVPPLEKTIQHELGHLTAYHIYGTFTPDKKYLDAIAADNNIINEYSDINTAENLPDIVKAYIETHDASEDFANAMTVYISTNAGLYHPEVSKKYAHRFAVLDEIMGVTPSERERITEINNSFELFKAQANDLLEKFGLPTIDKIEIVETTNGNIYKISEEMDLFLTEALFKDYLEYLKNFIEYLKENPDAMDREMVKLFEDKVISSQRERSTDIYSSENSLKMSILSYLLSDKVKDDDIPEFIIETIHLFDTLSTSEIEQRYTLWQKLIKSRQPSI